MSQMPKEQQEIIEKEQKWEIEKDIKEREYKIRQDKDQLKSKYKKRVSTSKLLILFLFLSCSLIELFTGWVTVESLRLGETLMMFPDFSPLITLIGAVVGEVVGFAIYAVKSTKENTTGGIVYETTMAELNNNQNNYM